MQVADDVYQLKVPMRHNPLGYTYSYLLKNGKTLIDTGIPSWDAFIALEKQLAEQEIKVRDLQKVIVTHMHNDHVGLIEYLKERSDIKIYTHSSAVDRQKAQITLYQDMYRSTATELQLMGGGTFQQFFSRFEHSFREIPKPMPIDDTLEDNQTIKIENKTLRTIWTPGHAPEHICLYDADNRVLFSGDHILPKITSHVSLHTWEDRDPLNDYLTSLNKVKDLPIDLILPGHEKNFTNLNDRIIQLNAHHQARLDEVKNALKNGGRTVFQVSSKISWDSRPWPLMDFWTKRMAAAETYAHLIYLRNKGEVNEKTVENVLYYSISARL